jgi:hypothetical protein
MRRKAVNGELRANVHMGAIGSDIGLSPELERIAIKCAKILNVDVCAIDILEGIKPKIIEINLSPGLVGITQATGKNIAEKVIRFLVKKTQEFKKIKVKKSYEEIVRDLKREESNRIISNLDIKFDKIRLPSVVTKLCCFKSDEEVLILAEKGKLLVKRLDIKK